MIFIYPRPPKHSVKNTKPRRISASFIELGLSLGFNKKLVTLCDKSEFEVLPQNLIQLNQNRIIEFNSASKKPIDSILSKKDKQDLLSTALNLILQKKSSKV